MQTRRIVFTFGVASDTPPEKLRCGDMVRQIITDVGETKFDRAHFLGFDRDRLTFEVVHIVNTADYNKYMDIQQEINIRILEGLNAQRLSWRCPAWCCTHRGCRIEQLKRHRQRSRADKARRGGGRID